MSVLVSATPNGWAVDCLDCFGNHGGPMDLGEWTTRTEADIAARAHRLYHKGRAVCPSCGRELPDEGIA